MADTDLFNDLLIEYQPPRAAGWQAEFVKALNRGASELGVSARDLALAMSYETERTFDSAHKGKGLASGRFGLIQAGPEEAKTYGFDPGQSPADQVDSVVAYLKDRGLKPGMGLEDIYSTINAGAPGLLDRSDRPGETVASHVARMSDPKGIYAKATDELLAGFPVVEASGDSDPTPEVSFEGIDLPPAEQHPSERDATLAAAASALAGQPFTANSGAQWGRGLDFANKLLLGAGKPLMAGAQAAKEAVREVGEGSTIGEALSGTGDTYSQAKAAYDQAQAEWAAQNPGQDIGNLLIGATIPTVAALAYTKGKATPLVEQGLVAASPRYGPTMARFLAGESKNMLTRGMSYGLTGAMEGALSGVMQHGLTENTLLEDLTQGATFGGAANPLFKALGPSIGKLFNAAVTKPVATIAEKAKNLGIQLKGPQLTKDLNVRKLGAKAEALGDDEQLAQYTRAVSKEFGEDTDTITKDVIKSAKDRIGKAFENIAQGVTNNIGDIPFRQTLTFLKTKAFNEAGGNASNPTYQMVRNWAGTFERAAKNGLLDGEAFRSFTRRDSAFSRGMMQTDDPNLRYYGGLMYEALHDALERNGPAGIKDALAQTKQQWAALKQIEPIAEKSWPSGVLDPQSLGSLRDSKTGNLGDLAEIGQLMPRVTKQGGAKPSSPSDLVGNLLGRLPDLVRLGGAGAAGAAAVHNAGPALNFLASNPLTAAATGAAALGGLGVNKYIQRLMNDPRYAEMLIAKGLGRPAPGMPLGAATIDALQKAGIPVGTEIVNQEE